MTRRAFLALVPVLLLAGCATPYVPVPQGYAGPTALLNDTLKRDGATRARFFVVQEIDGQRVDNALSRSRGASYGQGFALNVRTSTRAVPARAMKVKLLATEETGAPLEGMFRSAIGKRPPPAEGEVEFTPLAGAEYIVTGELTANGSVVWIQDAATNTPVTAKVASPK
jgi:hypothetical protein